MGVKILELQVVPESVLKYHLVISLPFAKTLKRAPVDGNYKLATFRVRPVLERERGSQKQFKTVLVAIGCQTRQPYSFVNMNDLNVIEKVSDLLGYHTETQYPKENLRAKLVSFGQCGDDAD
ncbi:hypothetical protein ABEB36_001784 [Hypothenemus hampei]|uniref:Uncharacterized protein n=1 Tax=Hypothenemus hampei TaxID=57062 RepID=A0ABD1FFT0_HYPHA